MSSNMRIKKVCEQCGKVFIAKKTVSKTCSDECAKKLYKVKKRAEKINATNDDTRQILAAPMPQLTPSSNTNINQELIGVEVLSAMTGYSRRTIFRLMKNNPDLPRIQISQRSVKFQKDVIIKYLTEKFGNL